MLSVLLLYVRVHKYIIIFCLFIYFHTKVNGAHALNVRLLLWSNEDIYV